MDSRILRPLVRSMVALVASGMHDPAVNDLLIFFQDVEQELVRFGVPIYYIALSSPLSAILAKSFNGQETYIRYKGQLKFDVNVFILPHSFLSNLNKPG
jgi:hypothetical protein